MNMKLTIRYYPKLPKRKWMLIREGGSYDQHAHFLCKKDAENVRRLMLISILTTKSTN